MSVFQMVVLLKWLQVPSVSNIENRFGSASPAEGLTSHRPHGWPVGRDGETEGLADHHPQAGDWQARVFC